MRYVVLGGGIAGVCCALELSRCLREHVGLARGTDHAGAGGPQGPLQPNHNSAAAAVAAGGKGADGDGETEPGPGGSGAGGGGGSCGWEVVLVAGGSVVKEVREVARLSRLVQELEVVETPLEQLAQREGGQQGQDGQQGGQRELGGQVQERQGPAGGGSAGRLAVLSAVVTDVDLDARILRLQDGGAVPYDKLCICTGARPKGLGVPGSELHPAVLTLRDTDSVGRLAARLRGPPPCRRLLVVGNGGIALELVGALQQHHAANAQGEGSQQQQVQGQGQGRGGGAEGGVGGGDVGAQRAAGGEGEAGGGGDGLEVVWVLKHGHIGDAFFDVDAADFLLRRRLLAGQQQQGQPTRAGGLPEPQGTVCGMQFGDAGTQRVAEQATGGGAEVEGAAAAGSLTVHRASQHVAQGHAGQGQQGEQKGSDSAKYPGSGGPGGSGHAAGPAWTGQLLRGLGAAGAGAGAGAGVQGCGSGPAVGSTAGLGAGAGVGALAKGARGDGGGAQGHAVGGEADGSGAGRGSGGMRLVLERESVVAAVEEPVGDGGGEGGGGWGIRVRLSNGKVYDADLVVCAVGVEPATEWMPRRLRRAPDGGLEVGPDLRTSDPHVWAAGDCCTLVNTHAGVGGGGLHPGSSAGPGASPHWFQMRLWTQARLMGAYAAHCMVGVADELASGFNFELFTHVTRFLGCKVVLLGCYNGQGLDTAGSAEGADPRDTDPQDADPKGTDPRNGGVVLYSREGEAEDGSGPTFVRVLLQRGRMQGAVLLGETGLEETFENLILDGLDLSAYGPHILDPDFELEHFFD